ncbi:MAG: SusD/RagB family nutrient-binding outer membrane lipoprotein, partial [Saprospiraceae bacterium]
MKSLLFSIITMVSFSQCDTDNLHNLNINPQSVNQIDLNFLFTPALLSIASNGTNGNNRGTESSTNIGLCAYAMQHLADASESSPFGDKYIEKNEDVNIAPFAIYLDQLKNLTEILKQTGAGGYDEGHKKNMRNAARILRAWSFARLVDFYGNVPYQEASQGTAGFFFPKYDNGKFIYTKLLKELVEASSALSTVNPDEGFANADFVYKGDLIKWKKFGYSILLRLAMRMSDADPDLAAQYISKAVAGGVMTDNADNFVIPMALGPYIWVNQNGISRAFYPGDGSQTSFLSKTLIDFMKGKDLTSTTDDDPRLMIFSGGIGNWTSLGFTLTEGDPLKQKGMPNGHDPASLDIYEGKKVKINAEYSKINVKLLNQDEPYMIMNLGEVELLLAEAKLKNIGADGIPGTDKIHYEAGVKAAIQMMVMYDPSFEVSDVRVSKYLTAYPYGMAKPAIEMIAEQLWISKFLNWCEAWSDWRRLDLPKLIPTNHPSSSTGGKIPLRLKYPSFEKA